MSYTELSIEERAAIQVGQYQKLSQREETARTLGRSPPLLAVSFVAIDSSCRLCRAFCTSLYA
ncbi:hypothetical protein PVE_R2G0725 [Pseudomonas veronii 1YdBTEX2]|uniref:Uncharacterized protein n=1 Tax=Pseudomonas veronii 1YdBTEX2 TaxID=1295141 RepID=A0A1D3K8W6_PSEVE|nr:hypothetical protein PVE_R2G0725 [Pseudomonas veronii 1YdBTEX2]